MIWQRLKDSFAGFPAQERVAKKLLGLGLRVSQGKVYCGDVQVKDVSLADSCGVDRRVVRATVSRIQDDAFLKPVFETVQPAGPLFLKSASVFKIQVLEIEPPNAAKPGIVADVTRVLAEHHVPIRQILTEDPELFENPKLFLLLSKKPSANVLKQLADLSSVKKLSVY
ncbi:amino acid-binding protein [Candidatus Micrarchaeota archaeon]|nr:amino acid-binding protein [Candidatus Micrarchaeota archaeon]